MVTRFLCTLILAVLMAGCVDKWKDNSSPQRGTTTGFVDDPEKMAPMSAGIGGGPAARFKVPVPPGYKWEVTQSWGEHCTYCDTQYADWWYCDPEMSHLWDCCLHGWDFNLPLTSDAGKPVLASGSGTIKTADFSTTWGNMVIIDHGGGICTRYAHMQDESTDHLTVGQDVCQGLKLGEIGRTGNSQGDHLHFQFEDCTTLDTLAMGFDDGNGIPVCVRDGDVNDANGNYTALILTNQLRENCTGPGNVSGNGSLPIGGWYPASCGTLPDCPMNPNCDRSSGHVFEDESQLIQRTADAAAYLWGECVIDGKSDGGLHPLDFITRAEALKVSLFLYGLMNGCGGGESFPDVDQDDWFFQVVVCAVSHGIIDSLNTYFMPDEPVTFFEAAEYLVKAAALAGVIEIQNPEEGHFEHVVRGMWEYPYAETLYAYGGLVVNSLRHRTYTRRLERREFVIMAASLSPCFCSNVSCDGSCVCVQEAYSCVDPSDRSAGIGGAAENGGDENDDDGVLILVDGVPVDFAGPSEDEDEEEDEEEEEEEEEEEASGWDEDDGMDEDEGENASFPPPDVAISCFLDAEDTACGAIETVFQVKCSVSNNGDEVLRINNLVMHMTDDNDAPVCQVTDPDLRRGVGTQHVDPGETRTPNGHFEIACESPPSDEEIELSFDLILRNSGVVTEFEEYLETVLPLVAADFARCEPLSSEPVPSEEPEASVPAEDPEPSGPVLPPVEEEESDDDEEETSAVLLDVAISCFLDTEDTECGPVETVFEVKCSVENNTDEVLRINNLVMHMTDEDDAPMCQVTDPDLRRGVGTQHVDPGETRTPNGHFEIACESPPSDEEIELSFDLILRNSGVVTEFEELLETVLPLGAADFARCEPLP